MSIIGAPEIYSALNNINQTLKELVSAIKDIKLNNYNSHFIQYTDRIKGDEIVGPIAPNIPRGPIC